MGTWLAIKEFFAPIPRWAYILMGSMLLLTGLVFWHQSALRKHDRKLIIAEDARLVGEINKVTAKITRLATKAAMLEREAHEKEVTRIGVVTHDLILRGPGKAQCPSSSFAPRTSQLVPSGGSADASLARVPDQGGPALVALPFNDAVRFAGQCDINRDEILKWRENRQKLEEINGNFPHAN